jgi:hypothetical protein
MNKITKYISVACIFMAMIACEKTLLDDNIQWQYSDPSNANLKVLNAYTSNVPAGAPGVGVTRFYVYQEKTKLNGNALTAPGSWPSTATYASIKAGKANYFLLLDRRVGNDYGTYVKGDTAFKANLDLQAGKFYTAFLVGASPTQEVMLVEDEMIEPAVGKYRLRIANLVPDPARPIDVYSRREKRKIVTGLDYKKVGGFIELSIPTISDTLDVFDATSPTKALYFATFLPVSKKVYTFYAQGRRGFRTEGLNIYVNR